MSSSRIVAGAFLIVLGIGWLLQTAGIVHFQSDIIAPISLIGIGVALVIGAPRGLHVPLFVGGIILAAVLAGDSGRIHLRSVPNFDAGSGGPLETPRSAEDLLHPYHLGAGNLTIDLTYLPLNGETYPVSASVGTGRLSVLVPSGTSVSVNANTGVGSSNVFGRHTAGASTQSHVSFDYPGRTNFVITLRVGAGTIDVKHRESALRPNGA